MEMVELKQESNAMMGITKIGMAVQSLAQFNMVTLVRESLLNAFDP